MDDQLHCTKCGCYYKDTHDEWECDEVQYWRDIGSTCCTYETKCKCSDCNIYFNPSIQRPIQGFGVDDETFQKVLSTMEHTEFKQMMKESRIRNNVFAFVPYALWNDLINTANYNRVKEIVAVPPDDPEICEISICDYNNEPCISVHYRFPKSTVKYDMLINMETGRIKTHSRGAEYYDKL